MAADMYQNVLDCTLNPNYTHTHKHTHTYSSLLDEPLTANPDISFHFLSRFFLMKVKIN